MLGALSEEGARVDRSGGIVRFPSKLQEQALLSAPSSFVLYAPPSGAPPDSGGTAEALPVPRPRSGFYICTGTGGRGYLDPETGRYRPLTLADVRTWGQLAGALDHIDLCAFPTPTDVPPETVDVHSLSALLGSTTKHVWIQPHTERSLPYLFELCAARSGGKNHLRTQPLASIIACSLTPFRFKQMDIEVILQACEYGLPVHLSSLPVIGGTSPITTVGTVLTAAIEVLAMVIMTQIVRPGHPVFALATALAMDMRSGRAVKACPEAMQANALSAQFLTEAYGLPVHTAGLTSDAFGTDGQAMVELSLEGDATAWQDILSVSPGGHFLETEHTLRHCREALRPGLFVRQSRDAWAAEGETTLIDRARDRFRQLIAAAGRPEVDSGTVQAMESIVTEADRALVP
jgi:trimethylamine--corrinoid protein Co-methyltransferase